jgi:hypothetical protein
MKESQMYRPLISAALVLSLIPIAGGAASNKELQHLKGETGYEANADSRFQPVRGSFVLPDDAYAVTQDKSAALLTLPDSSIVAFGQNTRVQVGAFNDTAAGPGSTITVNNGTLRFDIRRPAGGAANYRFITPTSQLAVRGTVGLLSFIAGNTTVACLACAADSITMTVGSQTLTVVTGQVVTVSATGAVATGGLTSAVTSSFSSAGVSTSASSGLAAATSGIAASAAAPAAAAGAAGAAAAGAAAGAAASIITSSQATPVPTSIPATVNITGAHPPSLGAPGGARRPF